MALLRSRRPTNPVEAQQLKAKSAMDKSVDAFRTISEVADELAVPQHVLRFWETRFPQIKPLKRGGGRRYYRPDDVALVRAIKQLLYGEGYTIKGVQRILKEQGVRAVIGAVRGGGEGQDGVASGPNPEGPDDDGAEPADIGRADESAAEEPLFAADGQVKSSAAKFSVANPPPAMPPGMTLSPASLGRLQAALAEIDECTRLLAAARL